MNRGFQTICFALSLSFAVPGYAIDKQDVAASQEPPSASDSAAGSESPSTSAQAEDCQGPQGNRRSSICAEWKAADAAADSAKWAQWALAVGGLGVLLGAGTLFAAFRAAHWAKIAAAHTEEGSKGAVQAANESRLANQISQGVQRAWVTIAANPQSSQRTETGHSFRFEIISENVGQTPATHLSCSHNSFSTQSTYRPICCAIERERLLRRPERRTRNDRMQSWRRVSERPHSFGRPLMPPNSCAKSWMDFWLATSFLLSRTTIGLFRNQVCSRLLGAPS